MSVRYTRDALRDLEQISSYLAEQNAPAAAGLLDAVEKIVARLNRFPYSAPQTEMSGIRAASVLRYPYIIFYTVEGDEVLIHYIRHAARLRPWEQQ
jgi:addiction module RelE/StbE family toxin